MFTPAFAWDSDHYEYLLPIGTSTHTYFVDYAVEQLQTKYPDAVKYRALLREGANIEFVGPLTENTLPHWVDIEERFAAHEATRFRAGDIEGWWNDVIEAYRGGHPERAYFLLGVVLHFIQDVGVPAKAKNLDHGIGVTDFDSFEYMAAYNWTNPAPPKASEASPANLKTMLDFYSAAIAKSHEDAPNYNDTSSFSNTWTLASPEEQDLLIMRQQHTALMTTWVLSFALSQFESITPSDPTCDVTICRPLYVFVFENAPMAATAKAETEAAIAIWLKAGIRFTPVYRTIKLTEIESLLGDLDVKGAVPPPFGGLEQFEKDQQDWDALFKLKPSGEAFAVFFVKVEEGIVAGLTNPAWADIFKRKQVYIGRPFGPYEASSSPPRTIAHELGHLLLGAACHKGSTKSTCANRPTSDLMGGPEKFGSYTNISIQDGLRARARARRLPQ